jgi:hypothetical protein
MPNVTAASAEKIAPMGVNDRKTSGETRISSETRVSSETVPLDSRYGKIGISAVAAAARYQGDGQNPACASESAKWRDLFAEAAA